MIFVTGRGLEQSIHDRVNDCLFKHRDDEAGIESAHGPDRNRVLCDCIKC